MSNILNKNGIEKVTCAEVIQNVKYLKHKSTDGIFLFLSPVSPEIWVFFKIQYVNFETNSKITKERPMHINPKVVLRAIKPEI